MQAGVGFSEFVRLALEDGEPNPASYRHMSPNVLAIVRPNAPGEPRRDER